jgi:hypothetical protein
MSFMGRSIVLSAVQHSGTPDRRTKAMGDRGTPGPPVPRWVRLSGLAVLGAVIAAATATLLVPLAARIFVRGIVLLAAVCVWLATSLSTGTSGWTMLATAWQAASNAMASPTASAILWGFVILGALALYWLQRLLGSEQE